MHQFYGSNKTDADSHESGHAQAAVRSYEQIAEILAQREGKPVNPARVRQICCSAQVKIARALLRDPKIERLLRRAAQRPNDWTTRRSPGDSLLTNTDLLAEEDTEELGLKLHGQGASARQAL